MHSKKIPQVGILGLKENFRSDLVAGFTISLIALPLCIAIAKASQFPAMAGLIAAIVGGLLVSRINGSFMTISGPAAGLIVVNEAAVIGLGGVQYALAAILVAGGIVFLLGLMRAGKLGALFPANAVHGMLAAIGVIIIAKQIHVALLGVSKKGEPLELLAEIPESIRHLHTGAAILGGIALAILILHPMIKVKVIKMIPAALWVLLATVPVGIFLGIPSEMRVNLPANPIASLQFPDFSKIAESPFWISVVTIALVTFIETMASASAVEKLDPFKRKTNMSRDVAAIGVGSGVSSAIGGLPMIAEIVRSSANINSGARTGWANFFHGAFLFVFVVALSPIINLIPSPALAAMLVFTGFRLASPKTFRHAAHLGWDQLVVFLTTLGVTLATDLLIGIGAGILVQLMLNIGFGGFKGLFRPKLEVKVEEDSYRVSLVGNGVFTNILGIQSELGKIPSGKTVRIDLGATRLVDHSVLEILYDFERDYRAHGGICSVVGLDRHQAFSHHALSGKYLNGAGNTPREAALTPRQAALATLADQWGATFHPESTHSSISYEGFSLMEKWTVTKVENQLEGALHGWTFNLSEVTIDKGGFGASGMDHIHALVVKCPIGLPEFSMEPESFLDRFLDVVGYQDIDFDQFPQFSKAYLLRGTDEQAIRNFFSNQVLDYLGQTPNQGFSVTCNGEELLVLKEDRQLSISEQNALLTFLDGLIVAMAIELPKLKEMEMAKN